MHEPSTPELLFNATIYVISCLSQSRFFLNTVVEDDFVFHKSSFCFVVIFTGEVPSKQHELLLQLPSKRIQIVVQIGPYLVVDLEYALTQLQCQSPLPLCSFGSKPCQSSSKFLFCQSHHCKSQVSPVITLQASISQVLVIIFYTYLQCTMMGHDLPLQDLFTFL